MARRQRRGRAVFKSTCHLSIIRGGGFTLYLFIAERQARKLWTTIFIAFGLTQLRMEPESTVSVADSLSTRLLIGLYRTMRNADPSKRYRNRHVFGLQLVLLRNENKQPNITICLLTPCLNILSEVIF